MAPSWLAALAVLLLLGGAVAQPSFTFPAIPNLIAGQTADTKDLLVTLNNPVPNPPGPTFFPVTLTATLNNNLITMTPTQVTFNAAGSWQGVFTIAASSTAPPGFSPSFLAMTNITWAVDDTVHYAPPASFNVTVVPNTVDICVLSNCYPGGAGVPVIQIFPGFQSSTITFSTQYPPVNGLTYTLAATPTNGITFSPSATLSQGPGANVASFTVTTSTFPASGAITVVIGGPDVAFFAAYPTPPAGTMTYATTTIPIEVTPTPGATPVTILAGTSYTFTVNLAYPLPSGVSTVTLTPSLSGSGLSFSPTSLVYSGTTTSAVLTVTANRVLTSGVYTVSWTQNPTAAAGPYSAVPNLVISVPQRQIQFIWPGSVASPTNKIFIGEPFPLEIRLPTYPSGTITVSLAAPQTGGPALISFNPTSVTFSSTNNVTAAIITGTPNSFPLTSGFEYPNTFSVNIQVTLAGSDFALYAQPGTQTILVSRRQFYVPNQTPASMTLTMGLPSPPITVTAPLASTLAQLAGTVTLTPIVNSNPSLVFIPPFLSFSSTSQATQTVTVLLSEQADRSVTQAASTISVNWVLGGSVADLAYFSRVQPIANFPTFTWNPTPIRFWQNGAINQGSGALGASVALVAGESTSITMTVEFLPLTSVTVTVNCPEVSITPFGSAPSTSNTGTFTFTAGGSRSITFTIQALALSPNGRTMTFELSGPDAAFYARPTDVTVNVAARTVTLSAPASIQIGDISNDFFFTVPQLPINGITLTPMFGNNPVGPSDAVRFIPGSVSFGAGSAYVQTFSVVGSVLGTFTYTFVISGPDAAWYNFGTPANAVFVVTVGMRQAPVIDLPSNPNSGIIPGIPVGPFTAKLSIAPDSDLTISPTAPDWTFVPASLTFAAGQRFASFIGTWNPVNINSRTETGQTEIFYRVSGTDSWKYNYLAPTLYVANTITKRSFVLTTPQPMIFGTTHLGSIAINTDASTVTPRDVTVTPSSTGITFNPATWTMTATTRTVYFTYTTNVNPGVISNSPLNNNNVLISFTLSGTDANLFQVPGDLTLTVTQRTFVYDMNYQNSFTNNQASTTQFVVGKTYPLFSVATAQPLSGASSVTLTPTCRFAVFSPASATFTPTSSVASFTWTPTAVPPLGGAVRVDWILSGPDALVYTTGNLPTNTFTIVPPLVFSNPPLIPVDGTGVVTIALAPGYSPTEPFSVHISDDVNNPGIAHSPSIFHFQTGAVNSTQSFTIQHLRPSIFGNAPSGLNGYTLNYGIRYTGANGVVSNLIYYNAPLNAVAVRVSRYDIVPDFPFTIGYRFCPAAINLTRAPLADLTLIPDLIVNSNNGRLQGSRKEPAGRIIFDTPVIFFPAGQNYAAFNVRVDRRIDEEALYYRIDWTINAHPEDAATYLPFRSTWHMGAGSVASVTSLLVLATLLLLLL